MSWCCFFPHGGPSSLAQADIGQLEGNSGIRVSWQKNGRKGKEGAV